MPLFVLLRVNGLFTASTLEEFRYRKLVVAKSKNHKAN